MTQEANRNFTLDGDDQISCNIECRGRYVNSSSDGVLVSGVIPFKKFTKLCIHQQAPRKNAGKDMSEELAKIVAPHRICKIYS